MKYNEPIKPNEPIKQVARVKTIAERAGVSTATVDRVLNNRPNVRASTKQRVLQARAAIESGSTLSDNRPWRFKVILPKDAGPSTEHFATCIQNLGAQGKATVECEFASKMEPVQLARKLHACLDQRINAVAFQALDDPRVIQAATDLTAAGIPCTTVLSGIERSDLCAHVGTNNRAAGRSAGFMMGHMTRTPGDILIITGGDLYRAHESREIGFRAVLRKSFPHVNIVASLTGHDDINNTFQVLEKALKEYPDLVGIYNVGGGNEGIVKALRNANVAREITFIGHNLTTKTHAYLLEGSMNAIIHQNLKLAAQKTVNTLIAQVSDGLNKLQTIPVEIITRENTEGAEFGRE